MSGPLTGIKVIEMAGIGPGPFACMLMSDMGAEIIRIDRSSGANALASSKASPADVMARGRKSIAVNLKDPDGVEVVLKLVETADVIIDVYRPGVMEKLGLGPDVCAARNPGIVYGRMTGWGQDGPWAQAAGHDMNYIAITGALDAIGRKEGGPVPPLNLVGDFGGGSMYLVMGVLAALLERNNSGKGQVIDAAICDGVANLMSPIQGFAATGIWETGARQNNMLDGGAHYYDTYETSDGKWVSIGSIEPQFYDLLAEKLGIDIGPSDFMARLDKSRWPALKEKIAAQIKTKTRDEWDAIMGGTDVCYAPVLSMDEAPDHPHCKARGMFMESDGVVYSAPAPRFSRTPAAINGPQVNVGENTREILAAAGLDADALINSGAVA